MPIDYADALKKVLKAVGERLKTLGDLGYRPNTESQEPKKQVIHTPPAVDRSNKPPLTPKSQQGDKSPRSSSGENVKENDIKDTIDYE